MPILKPGEEILAGEHTKFYDTQGYLMLTSRRLIFEYKPRGLSKKMYTSIDMLLEGISNAFVEGMRKKKLVIITRPGFFGKDVVSRLEFSVRDPDSWQNRLTELRKSVPDTQVNPQATSWICPKCATLNPSDIQKCDRCGLPKPR
ncbi:MAG: zinc finger Ran-binding domain-containing protein [Candidatus Bathyarchaeales archaeon]